LVQLNDEGFELKLLKPLDQLREKISQGLVRSFLLVGFDDVFSAVAPFDLYNVGMSIKYLVLGAAKYGEEKKK
jgi:hypothetical protein